jgi:hypothetical protein
MAGKRSNKVDGHGKSQFQKPDSDFSAVGAKEELIVAGCELGINLRMLSEIVGLDDSTVSLRRCEGKINENEDAGKTIARVIRRYRRKR